MVISKHHPHHSLIQLKEKFLLFTLLKVVGVSSRVSSHADWKVHRLTRYNTFVRSQGVV